jgi:hypothetical protein
MGGTAIELPDGLRRVTSSAMEQGTVMEDGKRALPAKRCGARTRSDGECRKSAGWGTPHLGRGRCSLHGGCTPDHVKHAAREEALDFARNALGAEVADDPLDALLQAVRLASGAVAYWRLQLHEEPDPPERLREGFRLAVLDLAKISKAAVDAGVAERVVKITERMAEQITLAAEEGLAALKLDVAQRTLFARVFAQALERLEGEPIVGQAKQLAA